MNPPFTTVMWDGLMLALTLGAIRDFALECDESPLREFVLSQTRGLDPEDENGINDDAP